MKERLLEMDEGNNEKKKKGREIEMDGGNSR